MRKHLYCSMKVIIKEIEDEDDLYNERYPRMPPLGSRVRRGRDWQWGDQDMFGSGTVVGHSKTGIPVNSIIGKTYNKNNHNLYIVASFAFHTLSQEI